MGRLGLLGVGLLDQTVPLSTVRTAPVPLRMLCPAGLTRVNRASLCQDYPLLDLVIAQKTKTR